MMGSCNAKQFIKDKPRRNILYTPYSYDFSNGLKVLQPPGIKGKSTKIIWAP